MAIYGIWNNKGGVGKSYLTFQIACEYARQHPDQKILVVDLCPQANASMMLFGGIVMGEQHLDSLSAATPRRTIAGYIEDRIRTPYGSTGSGSQYLTHVGQHNHYVPSNVYLVAGDEELEIQTSRVSGATMPGPPDAWRLVHGWISDLIGDIRRSWNVDDSTVFIDCNPSFSIYTELAMSASDRLIIPFSADGSSKRAVKAVLSLLYGINRSSGGQVSEFSINSGRYRLTIPQIYCYVGNRMTQANSSSASAFRSVVNAIGDEIWSVWQARPNVFRIHPAGAGAPGNRRDFRAMFQAEIRDANTASVVSGALGIPISRLTAGPKLINGRNSVVNESQLQVLRPNIQTLVSTIE